MTELTSIIILAWNQMSYSMQCLQSILENTQEPYELILIDNGSTDATCSYFCSIPKATVIKNSVNLGFAKGCNQGIKLASGNKILLLNNDTIVSHNWLSNMVSCLESRKDIGLVSCYTNYVGSENQLSAAFNNIEEYHKFAKSFNQPDASKWREIQSGWLSGFCLLIKSEVIEKIGYLDEQFQYGGQEDVDYCMRVIADSYKLYLSGDTFIYHHGSKTFHGNNLPIDKIMQQNKELRDKKWNKI